MTGLAGRRVWGLLTAALAALLLVLAPTGHAQAAGQGQATSAVQAAVAHDNDAVAVPPSTRVAAARTAGSSADADVAHSDSQPTKGSEVRTADRHDLAAQTDAEPASARAPPLKG